MPKRTSAHSGLGRLANLMTLAGLFFVLAGGFMAYPAIRDATLPPPTTFGEEQPVLRPQ